MYIYSKIIICIESEQVGLTYQKKKRTSWIKIIFPHYVIGSIKVHLYFASTRCIFHVQKLKLNIYKKKLKLNFVRPWKVKCCVLSVLFFDFCLRLASSNWKCVIDSLVYKRDWKFYSKNWWGGQIGLY